MSRYQIEMSRVVRETITHLPPEFRRKVKSALRSLEQDLYQPKELKEELAGLRSYRIGKEDSAHLTYRRNCG
jgi:mRNA-degrading endonuclease RelE of RelBE toxin-antitoxin system